ncbi:MAG: hypothetical protein ACTHON_17460, partial [Humibacter sp.]
GSAYAAPATAPLDNGGTAAFSLDGSAATLAVTGDTTARYRFAGSSATTHEGADRVWTTTLTTHPADRQASLTLDDLVQIADGRIPVGIDPSRAHGPFTASWTSTSRVTAYSYGDGLVDASGSGRTVLTISGGGLTGPRAFAVPDDGAVWSVKASHVATVSAAIAASQASTSEAMLWKLWLPLVFAIAAIVLAIRALRARRALTTTTSTPQQQVAAPPAPATADAAENATSPTTTRSTPYAAK